jgi:membrane-bound lytic murein transglycosylase MltF
MHNILSRFLACALLTVTVAACGNDESGGAAESLAARPDTVALSETASLEETVAIAESAQASDTIAAAEQAATAANPDPDATPGQQGAPGERPAAMSGRWTGDLDALEQRRVLRILTVYTPGRFYLEEGRGRGIVAEMAARLEKYLNDNLGRGHVKVYTIVIPVARDQLVPALLEGRGDIISAGLTITPEREELVDFSIPASKPLNEILVTGPSAPTIKSLEDLAGQTVYLRESSSYRESVDALSAKLGAKGLEPVQIELMPGSLEDDDLIEMVNAGLLPWVVVDEYKPQLWQGVFENIVVRNDLIFREGGRIAWAMRKDSPELKATVNAFLRENREGTLIGNIMVNRYIKNFDWAANALGNEDYKRFNDLEHLFERYGEQYGIEYLFAAAQGYQESRLDQNVRSSAGAVGVMQLLPATAADKNVAIPDIHEVEPNIHAGIKYMKFLRDRYFDDPDITPLNQSLLALGAYNAGPTRMIRMRSLAAERGYDPNVWFDNVELIAAEKIGRETVQYVSNIYRYYLTYRMVERREQERMAARRAAGISDEPDR